MRMYIDDLRKPKGNFDMVVRSSQSAIDYMTWKGCPDFISFDHDLGGDDTAMKVVKWMVEMDLDKPGWIPEDFNFYVHSANNCGSDNIQSYLGSYLKFRYNNKNNH